MKQKFFLLFFAICFYSVVFSQMYMTRNGVIKFHSKTPLENIDATNNQVYAVIDAGKKNVAFTLLMKGFLFDRELMQEHFNENYVESNKYPKASFNGSYTGDVDAAKDGVYNVTVKGSLTLHNVTKTIESPATIEVKNKALSGKAQFMVKPEDYNINIPSLVRGKIDKEIAVTVQADCAFFK